MNSYQRAPLNRAIPYPLVLVVPLCYPFNETAGTSHLTTPLRRLSTRTSLLAMTRYADLNSTSSSGSILLTTLPTRADAERLARVLVDERLCGCVSLVPGVASVYRWQGEVVTESEVQLFIKTSEEALPAVRRRVIELHPYELPAITVMPVTFGASFGTWVSDEVAPAIRESIPTVAILASGRGSNARALLEHQSSYRVSAILSDRPDAPVKEIAAEHTVKCIAHPRAQFANTTEAQRAIVATLTDLSPDLIVLAGFMQILKPWFVERFAGRLINIHPSLLPKYPGLNTHERAITAGDTHHGATVHLVDSGVDTGPIIAQVAVPIELTDTAESLAAKVLTREHELLPWVVDMIAQGSIEIGGALSVTVSDTAARDARERGFIVPS